MILLNEQHLSKLEYEVFCKDNYVSIFSQPWWMDAICGEKNWGVWIYKPGNEVLAAMPYFLTERDGCQLITKATITQNNGLIIHYPTKKNQEQKYCSRLDYEDTIMNCAIDYIENLGIDRYEQQFHYNVTNYLPFLWRGYRAMPRYTYVIEDTTDLIKVESEFSSKLRNKIKNAKAKVTLSLSGNTEDFYRVNELSFSSLGNLIPYSYEEFLTFHRACQAHHCGQMLFAVDTEGLIYSVAYLVWDDHSVYYLLNGTDPLYKSSQSNAFLVYESIKIASNLKKSFDFEGSVIKRIENFYRQFGGKQKMYFRIYKTLNANIPEKIY